MMHLTIKIFPYDPHWGGGFGWLVLPAPGGDRICSLASSERPSATPELAITAAEHWIAQHALGDPSTSLDLPRHPHPLRDAGVSWICECKYMTNTLGDASGPGSSPSVEPQGIEAETAETHSGSVHESAPEVADALRRAEYETVVFKFANNEARKAFFAKYLPGNPFNGELLPGVTVVAMSLSDSIHENTLYESALERIADGERYPEEIAESALDHIP